MTEIKDEHVTYKELYLAYVDCRRTKRRTTNALEFEMRDNALLRRLWLDLNTGKYEIGRSITFCVEKPVKREVFAADFRDRIVHHLVINRINDYFEESFIRDSYSCRKGKGTSDCVQRCDFHIKEASQTYRTPTWIVKCDLKAYFMSIDKNRLYDKLAKFLAEKECPDLEYTLSLLRQIIFNRPQERCVRRQPERCWEGLPKDKSLFGVKGDRGLPIGNLTSQILANFYLDDFDHWVRDVLGVEHYGRYVDDFFFLCHSVKEAKEIVGKCRIRLAEDGVNLHPKKVYIQRVEKGVKMTGAVIKPHRIYVANRTKGNFYEKLRTMGEPDAERAKEFVSSVNSYLGFMVHYKTYNIRRKVLEGDFMKGWYKYCWVSEDFKKIGMKKKAA